MMLIRQWWIRLVAMYYRSRLDREPDEIKEVVLVDKVEHCIYDTIDLEELEAMQRATPWWQKARWWIQHYWWHFTDPFQPEPEYAWYWHWIYKVRRFISWPFRVVRWKYLYLRRRWRLATGREMLTGIVVRSETREIQE